MYYIRVSPNKCPTQTDKQGCGYWSESGAETSQHTLALPFHLQDLSPNDHLTSLCPTLLAGEQECAD
eukprot:3805524-Pyramimonas_sp.AAC.1